VRFDLHVHTTASDGTLPPAEIVRRAAAGGLTAIAITDHDSVEGVPEALQAAAELDDSLYVIPGVELSAVHDGRDVHILGYFVDHTDPTLRAHLADLRAARLSRARAIVDALAAAGYELSLTEVMDLSDGGAVGRSHVARALVRRGHAADVSDAFRRLLGRGRPFYVPKDVRTPSGVLRVILEAGGIPVLAHPGVTGVDDLIPALLAEGLAGLEAFHAEHTPEDRERYRALAARLGLLATGGTDYHGPSAPNPSLGSTEMPDSALTELLYAAGVPGVTTPFPHD
jgi:3',5'-nucleoside bisphosphate phosphatase